MDISFEEFSSSINQRQIDYLAWEIRWSAKNSRVTQADRAPRMFIKFDVRFRRSRGLAVTFSDSLTLHTRRPALHGTLESETDLPADTIRRLVACVALRNWKQFAFAEGIRRTLNQPNTRLFALRVKCGR